MFVQHFRRTIRRHIEAIEELSLVIVVVGFRVDDTRGSVDAGVKVTSVVESLAGDNDDKKIIESLRQRSIDTLQELQAEGYY